MTNTVTFPPAVGGDGSTVTDDSSATTGLANGGFRMRLVPMFTQIVAIANWILGSANAAGVSATNAFNSASAASTWAANASNSAGAAATNAANALASAQAAAASAPLPSTAGNSGKWLTNNGIVASWAALTAAALGALAKGGDTATGKMHFTATDSASTALGNVSGAVSIDCSAAQSYSFTPTAAVTLSFTNPPAANTSQVILLKVTNGGAFTLSFPAGTKYPGGSLGTLTSSGVDWLGVAYDAAASAWVVFVLGKAVA